MKREFRYLVLKFKDINKYLTREEKETLLALTKKLSKGRDKDGKQQLDCVVVEHDWPEYKPTWAAIAARVDGIPLYKAAIDQDIKYNGYDG